MRSVNAGDTFHWKGLTLFRSSFLVLFYCRITVFGYEKTNRDADLRRSQSNLKKNLSGATGM